MSPTILKAEAEALRFLERVVTLRNAIKAAEPDMRRYYAAIDCNYYPSVSDAPKHHAALKRASMDLTRALSALRGRAK